MTEEPQPNSMPATGPVPAPQQPPMPPAAPSQPSAPAGVEAYPSNPLTTIKISIKQLLSNANRIIGGVIALQVGLTLAALVSLFLSLAAGVAIAFKTWSSGALGSSGMSTTAFNDTAQIFSFVNNLDYSVLILIILIGFFIAGLLFTYSQAVQTALITSAVIDKQQPLLGDVFKMAKKRFWPFVGTGVLLTLGAGVLFLLPILIISLTLVNTSPGSALTQGLALSGFLIIYYIIAAIIATYVGLRLGFSGFAVMAQQMRPVQALKYSWKLTRGHVWETVGVAAIAAAASSLIMLPLDLLIFAVKDVGAIAAILSIINFLLSLLVTLVLMAGFGERYAQYRNLMEHPATHRANISINFGALVLSVIALIVIGVINNALDPKSPSTPPYFQNSGGDTQQGDETNPFENMEEFNEEEFQKQLEEELRKYQERSDESNSQMYNEGATTPSLN